MNAVHTSDAIPKTGMKRRLIAAAHELGPAWSPARRMTIRAALPLTPQAGSAAFALSEAGNWKRGLEYMPGQAMRFYGVIASATLIGSLFDWISLDPVRALFWSAVLNGLVAVPIMVAMMILVSRRSVMGRFTASRSLLLFGWASTAVMAAAAFGLIGQAVLP